MGVISLNYEILGVALVLGPSTKGHSIGINMEKMIPYCSIHSILIYCTGECNLYINSFVVQHDSIV